MSSSRRLQQLEDVPELMQLIQLRLPVKEAARTMVLSKSWLHAWFSNSTLRFCVQEIEGERGMKVVDMDSILTRHIRDKLPIERFDLDIALRIKESASLAEKCIRTVATHKSSTTLKELSLLYHYWCIDLPHEILSCENLTKIRVVGPWCSYGSLSPTSYSHDPVIISCVSLRELYLEYVNISQEILDGILSSCKLLVKIDLISVNRFPGLPLNTIKVTNLLCLCHLRITGIRSPKTLEINHVPNLQVFSWEQKFENPYVEFNTHLIPLGSSLKELSLGNMVTSDASLDMIKSEAPLLENLTLDLENWELGSFHFTCASIKRLSLKCCQPKLIDIKVYASNLLFFHLDCRDIMPSLLFPVSTMIKETTFRLDLWTPVDVSFFLKMREALAISSNCNLYIKTYPSLNIDIAGDLRRRLPFPHAMNVQRLSLQTWCNKHTWGWEGYPFIDALFEICHPNHVTAMQDPESSTTKNCFCKVMLMEVLKKKMNTPAYWLRCLKHVQIRYNKKWETLTDSHKSFLDRPTSDVDFKLEWR